MPMPSPRAQANLRRFDDFSDLVLSREARDSLARALEPAEWSLTIAPALGWWDSLIGVKIAFVSILPATGEFVSWSLLVGGHETSLLELVLSELARYYLGRDPSPSSWPQCTRLGLVDLLGAEQSRLSRFSPKASFRCK